VTLTGELRGYQSLKWRDAKRCLRDRRILLAMEKDRLCTEVAKTYDTHGADAGIATLCALLYFQCHGAPQTATRGVELYGDILKACMNKGEDKPWLSAKVQDMRFSVAWSTHGLTREWPLSPPKWRNLDLVGGLANIMLCMGAREMVDGTTSEQVGAASVMQFLKEGMEKKHESRVQKVEW